MDRSSLAGHGNPASLSASEKFVASTNLKASSGAGGSQPLGSLATNSHSYQMTDIFGRCFLRVCYWVEVFSSFTRRSEPVRHTPLSKTKPALQTPLLATAPESVSESSADPALAGSPAVGKA
jgi:hypothetical protein